MKKSLLPMKTVRDSEKQTFGKEALEKLLKQYFGYSEFRGKQLMAIEAVLSGRDCFCLMPTGGGKSMCYQIPALVKPGIVLVISPLIALMENQVAILKEKQIPAEFLSSTQTVHTKEKIHEDLNSGKPSVKLLYVTPELVATFGFMAKLMKLYNRGLLSLIAIDEAHCISTWGHDFRPSYRKLSSLRSKLPNVPVLALTATAAPNVEKDVIESLSLQHPLILRASFNRANIFYEVRYKDILKDAYTDLSNLLKSSGNVCAIVYCLERSTCDDLCGHLSKNGISSAAYHAGLNNKMRSSVLDDWLSSRTQVVVATVAFGMGIDRKDVRIVCHFNIPKSMEAFYQESGRAGRDQLPSRSVLYYGLDDRNRMEFILSKNDNKISQSSSSSDGLPKKALADFNQMVEYCENSSCRRKKILESFGEQVSTSFCRKSCDACKHPNQVTMNLEELHRVSSMSKRNGLAPVFINSSCWKEDSEFWNRDDEASCSDEDISNSDDGEDAISKLPRSKMLSKAGLDERFKALERAEEVYYQIKVQNKQGGGLADKKVITGTLREASKKRLLHALNQAQERFGNPLLDIEASATFLETECFKKYEKVGKTFYNSQIAATTRWLSSSSYEQIKGRLRSNTAIVNTESSLDSTPGATGSSFSSSVDLGGRVHTEASNEEPFNDVQLDESRQVEIPMEKLDLPPIPSFSEFVNKKGDGLRDPTSKSNCSLSREVHRRTDSEKQGRGNAEKKMRKK